MLLVRSASCLKAVSCVLRVGFCFACCGLRVTCYVLRVACCLLTESGIRVCAPVHDAVLIEAPLDELDTVIKKTQSLMAEASRIVLDGFELGSDAKEVRYPDRYMDKRGIVMWDTVMTILNTLEHPRQQTGTGVGSVPPPSILI